MVRLPPCTWYGLEAWPCGCHRPAWLLLADDRAGADSATSSPSTSTTERRPAAGTTRRPRLPARPASRRRRASAASATRPTSAARQVPLERLSAAVTNASDSSSPHGVRSPCDSRYHVLKSIVPAFCDTAAARGRRSSAAETGSLRRARARRAVRADRQRERRPRRRGVDAEERLAATLRGAGKPARPPTVCTKRTASSLYLRPLPQHLERHAGDDEILPGRGGTSSSRRGHRLRAPGDHLAVLNVDPGAQQVRLAEAVLVAQPLEVALPSRSGGGSS